MFETVNCICKFEYYFNCYNNYVKNLFHGQLFK